MYLDKAEVVNIIQEVFMIENKSTKEMIAISGAGIAGFTVGGIPGALIGALTAVSLYVLSGAVSYNSYPYVDLSKLTEEDMETLMRSVRVLVGAAVGDNATLLLTIVSSSPKLRQQIMEQVNNLLNKYK